MIKPNKNPPFLNEFLDYNLVVLNKSKDTVKEYNYDLAHFFKYIKFKFNLTDITDELDIKRNVEVNDFDIDTLKMIKLQDIHSFLAYLKRCYSSKPATLSRKVASIKEFFKYMCNIDKSISINPAQNLEAPKLGKRLPKYLTLEESKALLKTTSIFENPTGHGNHNNTKRNYAIIMLFLNCGMRLAELVNIDISDIDFENNKLNIIGKGNKERTIYLNKSCVKAINDYLKIRPNINCDALFLSERKNRIGRRTVQYIVKEELRLTGIEKSNRYSVHKLRHTAATLMYKYGNVDIRALQELLGHESLSTTEIYTHVDNEQIRNAVESNPLGNL